MALRALLVSTAIGKLAALGSVAGDTLLKLLASKSETIQLGAVRTVYDNMLKGADHDALVDEVEQLRDAVNQITKRPRP
jgi:hypothetical protein